MTLYEWLEQEGRQRKWLARKIGVSRSTISHWISGARRPSAQHRQQLEALVGQSLTGYGGANVACDMGQLKEAAR